MRSLTLALALALATATALLALQALQAQTVPAGGKDAAPGLAAILDSKANRKEKSDALRQLAIVGTKEALPTILPLLADPELSHMARYALQTMPDPAVDQALRQTLPALSGRQLVGVINTLGARQDPKAVKLLGNLLSNVDPDVAQASARALGNIGTKDAASLLLKALPKATPENLVAFGEGTLRCAEALTAKQPKVATQLYAALLARPTLPHQTRAAATRGSILVNPAKAASLLKAALANPDFAQFDAAVRTSMELPATDITQTLAAALPSMTPDRQIVVLQALARRNDPAGQPAVATLAASGDKSVRLAALRALPAFNTADTVPLLASLLADPDKDAALLAQEGLAATARPEVDALVLSMLNEPDPRRKLTALDLVARRRMSQTVPTLVKICADANPQVRAAAARRLGELASAADAGRVLDLALQAKPGADLDNLAQALATMAGREETGAAVAQQTVQRWEQTSPQHKAALLQTLAAAGGNDALRTVRAAVTNPDPAVRLGALRALAAWKTADASADLLALATGSSDATERLLCLRGYFAWASSGELASDQRLAMCTAAAGAVRDPEEKRLLLGALGGLRSAASLALVQPHLADPATREEAAAAVASIAGELISVRPAPATLVDALKAAMTATGNADLGKRLNALLQKTAP